LSESALFKTLLDKEDLLEIGSDVSERQDEDFAIRSIDPYRSFPSVSDDSIVGFEVERFHAFLF
jgi:hypothetical protein